MTETNRDKIEKVILDNFPNIVKPLGKEDIEVLNKYKDGSFGFSFMGIMLYANGCSDKGKSTHYPQGLIYHDGNVIFGIGFFDKYFREPAGHLHIIAPRGKDWLKTLTCFIEKFRSFTQFPRTSIYIRHLKETQYKELLKSDYKPITVDPWNIIAPSEDDTFNHRIIKIDDIIMYDYGGSIAVKSLMASRSNKFRKKAKMAYNRFQNFLRRNGLEYRIEAYRPNEHKKLAKTMITNYFKTQANIVSSTPEDYINLINFITVKPESDFSCFIGFITDKTGEKIPVSIFFGEKIDKNVIGLYITIALKNETDRIKKFDSMGFSAISQYTYIRIFDLLKKRGFDYVDLGGSEVESLNIFKRRFGASEKKTYWAVKE